MTDDERGRLTKLTDAQIASFIRNYRKHGVTTGGVFPLAGLLLEQKRRCASPFPYVEVARKIVEFANAASGVGSG